MIRHTLGKKRETRRLAGMLRLEALLVGFMFLLGGVACGVGGNSPDDQAVVDEKNGGVTLNSAGTEESNIEATLNIVGTEQGACLLRKMQLP